MSPTADDLRRKLRDLLERRTRGDLREQDFQRRCADASIALFRAVVGERLAPAESILAEHHIVHSHFKLTESLMREPVQATVSFFATQRRLVRVRGTMLPGRPVSCDEADATAVDDLAYARIGQIVRRAQRRWGEFCAGLAAMLLAFLARDALAITGPMLALLGGVGTLHGLLLPTRWIALVTRDASPAPPFEIHGVHRRSARELLAVVRAAVAAGQGHAPDHGLAENP